jgi:GTPase
LRGAGLDLLTAALTEHFQGAQVHGWLCLPPRSGAIRSDLYRMGGILSERVDERGRWWLEVRLPRRDIDRLLNDADRGCEFHPATAADLLAGTAQAS